MMTKKDFEVAAKFIGREYKENPLDLALVTEAFTEVFKKLNPKFDSAKFNLSVLKAAE